MLTEIHDEFPACHLKCILCGCSCKNSLLSRRITVHREETDVQLELIILCQPNSSQTTEAMLDELELDQLEARLDDYRISDLDRHQNAQVNLPQKAFDGIKTKIQQKLVNEYQRLKEEFKKKSVELEAQAQCLKEWERRSKTPHDGSQILNPLVVRTLYAPQGRSKAP